MADPDWKSKKDPKVWRKAVAKHDKAHPEQNKARWAVRGAVRNGSLKKPAKCPKCGRSGVRIIFHHTAKTNTYSEANRLVGKWLCTQCHQGTKGRKPEDFSRAAKRNHVNEKK